jgi:hypothetical protein
VTSDSAIAVSSAMTDLPSRASGLVTAIVVSRSLDA